MGGHHGIDHVIKMRYMYSSSVSSFVIGHWSLRSHVRKRTSPGRSVVCDPLGRSDVCCLLAHC